MSLKAKGLLKKTTLTQDYSYDSQRPQILTAVGSDTYGFDLFGNLSSIESGGVTKIFTFNALNHMSAAEVGSSYGYLYDENGDRVKKATSAQTDYFAGKYFEKRGSQTHRYVFNGTRRLGVVAADGSVRYIHGDHLGSSNIVTNATGDSVLHREFAPFGELVAETGSAADVKPGFTDKYRDDESGFNYFGARYYLPGVGRWASADPKYAETTKLGELLNQNRIRLWGYVQNRPMSLVDGAGLDIYYFGVNFSGFSQANGTSALGTGVSQTVGTAFDTAAQKVYAFSTSAVADFNNAKVIGTSAGVSVVTGYVKGDAAANFFGYGSTHTDSVAFSSVSKIYNEQGNLVGGETGISIKGVPGFTASSVTVDTYTKGVQIGTISSETASAIQNKIDTIDAHTLGVGPIGGEQKSSVSIQDILNSSSSPALNGPSDADVFTDGSACVLY